MGLFYQCSFSPYCSHRRAGVKEKNRNVCIYQRRDEQKIAQKNNKKKTKKP